MTLRSRFVKALEVLISNENPKPAEKKDQNYDKFLAQFTDNSDAQKIRELQTMVYGLSSKVTMLTDKVRELNEQINNLTMLNEELLYALEQGLEQAYETEEDKESSVSVNFKPKKFELN